MVVVVGGWWNTTCMNTNGCSCRVVRVWASGAPHEAIPHGRGLAPPSPRLHSHASQRAVFFHLTISLWWNARPSQLSSCKHPLQTPLGAGILRYCNNEWAWRPGRVVNWCYTSTWLPLTTSSHEGPECRGHCTLLFTNIHKCSHNAVFTNITLLVYVYRCQHHHHRSLREKTRRSDLIEVFREFSLWWTTEGARETPRGRLDPKTDRNSSPYWQPGR